MANVVGGRKRVELDLNELICEHDGNGVLLSVEDSGTGVEAQDVNRIFEAFFTTKAEGMGMGLSICRSIVESHGGRITVAKAIRHGSVFQVFLPGEKT
jgi:signal transduction histidine kinase